MALNTVPVKLVMVAIGEQGTHQRGSGGHGLHLPGDEGEVRLVAQLAGVQTSVETESQEKA